MSLCFKSCAKSGRSRGYGSILSMIIEKSRDYFRPSLFADEPTNVVRQQSVEFAAHASCLRDTLAGMQDSVEIARDINVKSAALVGESPASDLPVRC